MGKACTNISVYIPVLFTALSLDISQMGFISFIGLFVKYICISLISSFDIRKTGVQLLQFRICLSRFLNLKCLVQLLRIIINLSSFLNYTISLSCSGSGETSTIFPTSPFTSGAAFRVSAMLAVLTI